MNRYIFWILLCFSVSSAYAQQQWKLSDCIKYGLRNNRSMRVAENELLMAEAASREALAGYLPSVNLTGTIDDNLKVQQSIIPAGLFGPNDIKVAFTKKFNTNGLAQLDQIIYDQSLINGLKANRYNSEKAALNKEKKEEDLIYNIASAYYHIFVYREQLNLLLINDKIFEQQVSVMKLQVEKGVLLRTDLDKVLVNYYNNISQIRLSRSNVVLAENELKSAMGYPLSQPLPVDSTLQQWNSTADTAFTAQHLTSYRLAENNIMMLAIDAKRIRAEGIPKLSFYAKYGGLGFGDNLGESFKEINGYSAIGVKMSVSLFGGFKRRAQYRQAELKQTNARENLLLDQSKYQLDYENSRVKMLEAKVNVEDDRRNVDLAQSIMERTNFSYTRGVTDLIDWLNAQNSLKEAQNNYLNSLYKFLLACIDVEKANGTLKTYISSL